jgi:septum formation protein
MGKIILASSSPRRKQIMQQAGYKFRVIPSPYEETNTKTDFSLPEAGACGTGVREHDWEASAFFAHIEELAYQKAKAVADALSPPCERGEGGIPDITVIGADTLVVLDNEILCKPQDEAQAREMLRKLSGKTHMVVTAIAVIAGDEVRKNSTASRVTFAELTDEQIRRYVEEFKPLDKAGAYGIQEMPAGYIKSCQGSLENVIGLCPQALAELLQNIS